MNLYIGADLGTSALKLLLVDASGEIKKSVSREYDVKYPKPSFSEQEPSDWWNAFIDGAEQLLEGIDRSLIKGIGVGGQMHGLVILDEDDKVIRPTILWNDGRTDKETEYLNTVIGKQRLAELTANIAFAGFTAPKLLWLYANEPENFGRIKKIMLPKDYINYKLTGAYATDLSDAAGTLLLDVKNKCWSQEMLSVCKVESVEMPKLFESYQVIGGLLKNSAKQLSLPDGIPVVAGAGDNPAAAIGTGTVQSGKCNISLGTSGTVFVASKSFPKLSNNALHSFCHANGEYYIMGCILSAASCNKWFCEEILKDDDYVSLQAKINDDMLGRGHVFFLPYLMGERSPINDTDARGTFIGMRMDTKREDMLLALLEGVAFAIKDNLEIIKELGIDVTASGLCGGGARSPLWQKIFSNVLNIDIEIPATEEGPGYGAAMLAMVGAGEWSDIESCSRQFSRVKKTVSPDSETVKRYREQYEKYKKIYPALRGVFGEIK